FSTCIWALGRASRTQNVCRRRASDRPDVETLEARDLMTTGGNITGIVFSDAITNGVQDAGELPLAGVTIFADRNANGVLDAGEVSARSGADGRYTLALSQDGTFQPRQVEPLGFAETTAGAAVQAVFHAPLAPPRRSRGQTGIPGIPCNGRHRRASRGPHPGFTRVFPDARRRLQRRLCHGAVPGLVGAEH